MKKGIAKPWEGPAQWCDTSDSNDVVCNLKVTNHKYIRQCTPKQILMAYPEAIRRNQNKKRQRGLSRRQVAAAETPRESWPDLNIVSIDFCFLASNRDVMVSELDRQNIRD